MAENNPVQVESVKPDNLRGTYRYAASYGKDITQQKAYQQRRTALNSNDEK